MQLDKETLLKLHGQNIQALDPEELQYKDLVFKIFYILDGKALLIFLINRSKDLYNSLKDLEKNKKITDSLQANIEQFQRECLESPYKENILDAATASIPHSVSEELFDGLIEKIFGREIFTF